MTTYNEIFIMFLRKIDDPTLLQFSNDFRYEMMYGWLMSAVGKFKKCYTDLTDRDDIAAVFNNTLKDIEKEILANMMVVEWLEPQVNSLTNTSQYFGNSESKFYSQANHLEVLSALKESAEKRCRKLMRDYHTRNNTYTGTGDYSS